MTTEVKQDSEFKKLLEDKQYFNLPKVGDLVKGTIISASKNEVHIDMGGTFTGLVRGKECYSESEEYRNLKPGDEVEATVLEPENENGEIELSFRYAGRQKAWKIIKDVEEDNKITEAIITDANKGGLMIKVGSTMGFLPVSQLSPEHYPRVPGGDKNRILEILKSYIGQKFEVKIIDTDESEDKLIVSEKGAWEETQKDVINRYKVGQIVEGVVTAVTDFGIFVEFDKLEGLIHISEIAWKRIDNPSDFVKVGEHIKAEIIGIENSKIFLSMKKLQKDPWEGIEKRYQIGEKVKGKVLKANPFGLFVELDEDIHGLAHISQLSNKPISNIEEIAKTGDTVELYVVSMDAKNHRLGLSLLKPEPKKKEEATSEEKTSDKKTDKADGAEDKKEKPAKKVKAKETAKEEAEKTE
ncbi:S1 RNA-binding domain-containing protein [Candidatus Falkowbacteria bacterium]|uniref:30S ribosomal protein S1 n=1 Tax=Candidatus Buchananbacteria bacterium CG10_big_fil_rev_8_21_14_0_10_33_19 TaxID=1974525 RepID=A0A2H0W4W7_9BACT|nr:S1 RNA-binding domain-containing protein [Candidatus Falkowbacteria bacterium]PIS06344.1 MAG: 30S ribosomal protein S1 [Candidatus Buchananbacteria bacterium CG10_big_fil_rev_8_21_14_0_10_33_19]